MRIQSYTVMEQMFHLFQSRVSLVFRLALIWVDYSDTTNSLIHPSIIQKVKMNIINSNRNIEVYANPIEKIA